MSSVEPVLSVQPAPAKGWGCLGVLMVAVASVVIGVVAHGVVLAEMQYAWSYCFGMPWEMTYDLADSSRFEIPEAVGYFLLYSACLPVGLWVAWRVLRRRKRLVRLVAGLLTALVLISVVFAGDLMLNISAPYPPAADWEGSPPPPRCVAGRPPWWPTWLPARPPAHDLPRTR